MRELDGQTLFLPPHRPPRLPPGAALDPAKRRRGVRGAGTTRTVQCHGGHIQKEEPMRYLVTARVKRGREADLLQAIENGTLGVGSVAGDEYLRNMAQARLCGDGSVRWVEVCFCDLPLQEERPYWEEYFELLRVQDAHGRQRCRDLNGTEPWA